MNKFLLGLLAGAAATAAGFFAVKTLNENNDADYDDDIYDYPDPYDTDDIDFEINDSTIEDAVKDIAEDGAEAVEEAADAVADALDSAADAVSDAFGSED